MALPFLFTDNASATLGAPLSVGGGTLTLSSGGGALFPNPAPGQQFTLTLNDAATELLFETVWCTARAGDVLTIVRAQEGTVARVWNTGDFCWNGPTAGTMSNMVQTPHMLDASIAPVFAATQVQGRLSATGAASFNSTGQFGATVTAVDTSTGQTSPGIIVQSTGLGAQGARIQLQGTPGTTGTPNKTLRAQSGVFDIVNSSYTAPIFTLTDFGDVTSIRNITASGGATLSGGVTAGGSGSFVDASNNGLLLSGTGGSGANIHLHTGAGDKYIRAIANRLEVVNAAYTQGILTLDDVGNLTVLGAGSVAGSFNAGGNIVAAAISSGASVQSNNGNVTANNGRLRASIGARLSGDPNAGVILADFPASLAQTGYQFLPNGLIIQWGYQTLNGDWTIPEFFPIAFPTACFSVVCTEGAASGGWRDPVTGALTPTVHGVNGFVFNAFFHAGAQWSQSGAFWILGNLSTTWIAIGF